MNNPYEYSTDLGAYNNEMNNVINARAERLNAIRSGMEYKRDSKVAELQSKSTGLESSAREWLEGAIGGGLGSKEMVSGFPNVRKAVGISWSQSRINREKPTDSRLEMGLRAVCASWWRS